MVGQLVQIAGALAILVPFALLQFRRTTAGTIGYVAPNLVGSLVLAVDAFVEDQWGFLLLEGVWALVSAYGLAAVMRGRAAPAH